MISVGYANRMIPKPTRGIRKVKKSYRLDDIADLVEQKFYNDRSRMKAFARGIPKTVEGCEWLFNFVNEHFEYTTDPAKIQAVQSPDVMWHNLPRHGDCKSYTLFIACTLDQMGLPVQLKLVDYGNPIEKHIYPVTWLPDGTRIVLDVVHAQQNGAGFNEEKQPYMVLKNTNLKPGLYSIGAVREAAETIEQLEAHLADVPDHIVEAGRGDVTEMSEGHLDRVIMEERLRLMARSTNDPQLAADYEAGADAVIDGNIAGLGSVSDTEFTKRLSLFIKKTAKKNKPAFEDFNLKLKIPKNDAQVSGLFGFVKKIGKAFKRLFKKLANWMFKGMGRKMAPFFLFMWIKKPRGKAVLKRLKRQKKIFGWITKIGRFKSSQLKGIMANEIIKTTGKTPAGLLNTAANQTIAGDGKKVMEMLPAIFKTVGVLITAIKKIGKLFKKKSISVSENDTSDLGLIESTSTVRPGGGIIRTDKKPNNPGSSDSGGGTGIAIGLGLLGLALASR